jgi:RNA polymerase sigma-70 factor (ECF subfamily)
MVSSPALAAEPTTAPAERRAPLVERLDDGDFARFYEEVAPRLWAFLVSQTGDRTLADDLSQEAWTRVLSSRLEPESDEHFRRYLFRTAIHLVRDRGRRTARAPETGIDETDLPTPPPAPGLRTDLDRAFSALRPKERRLLWLAHVEGLDHKAIADAIGARAASVRVMLFRARGRLAELLGRTSELGRNR